MKDTSEMRIIQDTTHIAMASAKCTKLLPLNKFNQNSGNFKLGSLKCMILNLLKQNLGPLWSQPTVKRQFYVHDEFMQVCQNWPLDKL